MIARRALQLVVLLCALVACGGKDKRATTIKATLAAVNQARDAYIVFDGKAQNLIADTAQTRAEAVERLATYRAKRELIVEAFTVAYQAIATAAAINDDPSIKTMLTAVEALGKRWLELQKETP